MKATRVEVKSLLGKTYFADLPEVEILIEKKRLEWIEKPYSARAVSSNQDFDASGLLTDRCQWRPFDSGGATVMQLL